jgi:hypothetical protein
MIQRLLWVLVTAFLLYSLGLLAWRGCVRQPAGQAHLTAAVPFSPVAHPPRGSCEQSASLVPAALQNGLSRTTAPWSVFGRAETGWAIYEPLVAHEIGTACPADSAAFARALAAWQASRRLPASGVMDAPTLTAMRLAWLARRPFVAQSRRGCPPPPAPAALVQARPDEGYETKPIQLLPQALYAWRAMVAAARTESPAIAADRRLLAIFSGYRDPVGDTVHCALTGECGTIARALCSAHRTGLAMDLYLGSAPGYGPASSDDANRLYQSRTPAYLWLVANAARFGFVNYPFEPWHWEYVARTPRAEHQAWTTGPGVGQQRNLSDHRTPSAP